MKKTAQARSLKPRAMELRFNQFRIRPPPCNELIVGATFHNSPAFDAPAPVAFMFLFGTRTAPHVHAQYFVGMLYCREAVGNHEDCRGSASRKPLLYGLEHALFCYGVESRRGLVQD
mmetsp:Transcript_5106/g.8581  ORF Transcript_5106/g.8581 Transcript_5106/m.8581 type:complete len:117 (+) Transcript_5106:116-466(+)